MYFVDYVPAVDRFVALRERSVAREVDPAVGLAALDGRALRRVALFLLGAHGPRACFWQAFCALGCGQLGVLIGCPLWGRACIMRVHAASCALLLLHVQACRS